MRATCIFSERRIALILNLDRNHDMWTSENRFKGPDWGFEKPIHVSEAFETTGAAWRDMEIKRRVLCFLVTAIVNILVGNRATGYLYFCFFQYFWSVFCRFFGFCLVGLSLTP